MARRKADPEHIARLEREVFFDADEAEVAHLRPARPEPETWVATEDEAKRRRDVAWRRAGAVWLILFTSWVLVMIAAKLTTPHHSGDALSQSWVPLRVAAWVLMSAFFFLPVSVIVIAGMSVLVYYAARGRAPAWWAKLD